MDYFFDLESIDRLGEMSKHIKHSKHSKHSKHKEKSGERVKTNEKIAFIRVTIRTTL